MLKQLLEKEGLSLSNKKIEKLEYFANILMEWNKIHNLTGAKSVADIYKNIIDSIYPMSFIDTPKKVLDVGSGAGFPAIPLAILFDESEFVLCEPLRKRVSFLKYVSLELENIRVEASRVEDLENNKFDLIVSRAVTNTEMLVNITNHLSNSATKYLFYKGERVFDEINQLDSSLNYDIIQKNRRNYLYIKSL
ncbi:rRNA small subunit 7-methylguanosine (m7G) methyltransferase GidB [hydrothermal vent metagenome]|uniref:rRNA small subunit 7-methylguanosine (M7G) methyltransferase GidB n=1 Tax=hydrothermal vent metagenome TaxID=652676 RepID=A0A1W1EKD9_9ZZZZ